MKVKDIINKLKEFNSELEVMITDGYNLKFYNGDWEIREFDGSIDIGIGGTEIDQPDDELGENNV